MKECSFQPKIDKKSNNIVKKSRDKPEEPSYNSMYTRQQQTKDEKAKKLIDDAQKKEMDQCTFTPKLTSKQMMQQPQYAMQNQL